MKTISIITVLVTAAALTTFAQEGVVQDVKHVAKKTGETIKDGVETAAEKTKETVNSTDEKAAETTRKTHHKSSKTSSKVKRQTTDEQATAREADTPAPSPTP
jgi:Ni/Co efflux regulator RcnB